MPFFLLWLAFGVLAAVIASSKNRSFIGWLLLGCVFGIFALAAVAFMPALEAAAPRGSTKKCPKCAETIKAEALVCRYCGNALDPAPVTEMKL